MVPGAVAAQALGQLRQLDNGPCEALAAGQPY
jgi:hypothetical protein